ncbi:MAG: damage-inducible protein [Alphaproteobacteria bacterium]|nr:damage-inducible protein [Alphaproteobacteria bacterium]
MLPLGLPALDAALPEGGLALGRLHEVMAPAGEAGTGFAAALLARIAGAQGRVLWCGPMPYGPGLAEFGLDPDRVIFARTAPDAETLWAMEEGLRCPSLAAVLGEVGVLDLTAGRRLQLAAERWGVTAIALRRERRVTMSGSNRPPTLTLPRKGGGDSDFTPSPSMGEGRGGGASLGTGRRLEPSAATTRWRVAPMPGPLPGPLPCWAGRARWNLELLRCRGGAPRDFVLEWSHETRDLAVAAAADHRSSSSVEPGAPQADAAD